MFIKPSDYYQQQIKATGKVVDPEQLTIMQQFDVLWTSLTQKSTLTTRLKNSLGIKNPIKGIYLWGEVGRGKTFLMDCFYHCLPESTKLRMHFHQFMRKVHLELKTLQGNVNPLNLIAKKLSTEIKILCLDEFFVSDITDAMLLGELLKALFARGIILATTSNSPPDLLYKNGLQRERFLPAIQMLKTHTEVIQLISNKDYRLRHLTQAGVYYYPLNEESNQQMEAIFAAITHVQAITTESLTVLGRSITVIKRANKVAWFEFSALCGGHRSQNDYLAISNEFEIVLLSQVPVIKPSQRDLLINFIKLIDVLYDAKVKLIISAETPPAGIYPQGPLLFEFKRAESRLIEMQSNEYFGTRS